MRVVGIITTSVLAVVVLAVIVVLLMSIPDINRYLKMRRM
ncbi:DUF6893 family small protein [Aeromicrobium sp.]|jgi:hypothetical protein